MFFQWRHRDEQLLDFHQTGTQFATQTNKIKRIQIKTFNTAQVNRFNLPNCSKNECSGRINVKKDVHRVTMATVTETYSSTKRWRKEIIFKKKSCLSINNLSALSAYTWANNQERSLAAYAPLRADKHTHTHTHIHTFTAVCPHNSPLVNRDPCSTHTHGTQSHTHPHTLSGDGKNKQLNPRPTEAPVNSPMHSEALTTFIFQ